MSSWFQSQIGQYGRGNPRKPRLRSIVRTIRGLVITGGIPQERRVVVRLIKRMVGAYVNDGAILDPYDSDSLADIQEDVVTLMREWHRSQGGTRPFHFNALIDLYQEEIMERQSIHNMNMARASSQVIRRRPETSSRDLGGVSRHIASYLRH